MENENILLFIWGTAVVLVLWRSYKYAMQMIECAISVAVIVAVAVLVHWLMLSVSDGSLREFGVKGVNVINDHVSKIPISRDQAYQSLSKLVEPPSSLTSSTPGVFRQILDFAVQKITPAPAPTPIPTPMPTPPPETGLDAIAKWAIGKVFKQE